MAIQLTLVGGGMITHDQLLPSFYHLKRLGIIESIQICDRRVAPMRELAEAPDLREAFPDQSFKAFPDLSSGNEPAAADLYLKVLAQMPPRSLVMTAVPDQLHYGMIKASLEAGHHVISVKPLVLKGKQALELEKLAFDKGLFVGVEYHKRFDRRSLEARKSYQAGRFGQFRCGEAKLIEPWYYRHSNFQNWFTCENSDPFTYIGCHYVDLVYFITGLKPVEVAVRGIPGTFPNGNKGYLWSSAQVVFENQGILSVLNGLGYPDQGAGSNDQGMCLYCEGGDSGGLIHHNDQFRGVSHSYTDGSQKYPFRFINPDYMRLVPWSGAGLRPAGYGFDSVEALVQTAMSVNQACAGMPESKALAARQAKLKEIDQQGLIATPANSFINDLVVEAGRQSILNGGRSVALSSISV